MRPELSAQITGVGESPLFDGYVDKIEGGVVFGWARLGAKTDGRAEVALLIDGVEVARGMADRFRADLKSKDIGDGAYAYALSIPREFYDGIRHSIAVRTVEGDLTLQNKRFPFVTLYPDSGSADVVRDPVARKGAGKKPKSRNTSEKSKPAPFAGYPLLAETGFGAAAADAAWDRQVTSVTEHWSVKVRSNATKKQRRCAFSSESGLVLTWAQSTGQVQLLQKLSNGDLPPSAAGYQISVQALFPADVEVRDKLSWIGILEQEGDRVASVLVEFPITAARLGKNLAVAGTVHVAAFDPAKLYQLGIQFHPSAGQVAIHSVELTAVDMDRTKVTPAPAGLLRLSDTPAAQLSASAVGKTDRSSSIEIAASTMPPTGSVSTVAAERAAPVSSSVTVIDWRQMVAGLFDREWYSALALKDAPDSEDPFQHWWEHGRHKELSPHPLFDSAFYAAQLKGVDVADKDLFLHFLKHGVEGDADPHVCFSMEWYRLRYPDRHERHPWIDYVIHGQVARREPNWLFSERFLSNTCKGWGSESGPALARYLKRPQTSPLSPHPLLDLGFVLRQNPAMNAGKPYETFWAEYRSREIRTHYYFDARHYAAQVKDRRIRLRALADYTLYGEAQGLMPIPLFDPLWHRRRYGLSPGYDTALEEYTEIGEKLYRYPCPGFDPYYYLERYSDVVRAGQAPLRHFFMSGQRELRRPSSRFDLPWYAKRVPQASRERALEYFLSRGRSDGDAPHPAVTVDRRGHAADALTTFLGPEPSKSDVIPGVYTALLPPAPGDGGVSPPVAGQAWLVERFEQEAQTSSLLQADRLKRWELIARQYEVFDQSAAREFIRELDARFGQAPRKLPLVSVIVPTRNRATVLKNAIRSVLAQTYSDIELIVIDDGGTDGTDKLLQSHFTDPRLTYRRIAAGGVSAARNEGLRLAKGEYVAYLDSDNYWEPRYLELVIKAMLLAGARSGYSVLRIFDDGGAVRYRGDVYDGAALRRENYIDMNVFVHHREVFDRGLVFDQQLKRCVDWDFILGCVKLAEPLFVPIIGCNYVDDSGGLERITTSELSGDFYRVCQRNIDLVPHIVGEGPGGDCPLSVIWPISRADWEDAQDDLWAAVQHVARSDHELIIVNNTLPPAATNMLAALARHTRRVRVVNLWRTFLEYPAANLAATIARGKRLLLWRSGLVYDEVAVEALETAAGRFPGARMWLPLCIDDKGMLASQLARIDLSSNIFEPLLNGQPSLPLEGVVLGLAPVASPVLIDATTFSEQAGFDPVFAVSFGLADFAARLLASNADSTCLHFDVRIRARKPIAPPPMNGEYVRELDALKERWLGKLRVDPVLPEGSVLRNARMPKAVVVKWNLLPDPADGERITSSAISRPMTFALRCPAPGTADKLSWGDYHLAEALIEGFRRLGHSGVVELREQWNREQSAGDVVIHIRGITDVQPVRDALNVMWVISHPDKIRPEEYAAMDVVMVASTQLKDRLRQALGIKAHVLLQATDPSRFCADQVEAIVAVQDQALFVGNSRLQVRRIVIDAIQQGLPLSVFGKNWENLIPSRYVRGDYIANELLGNWYGSAMVVLNDHWPAMREYGVISNRIFDVVAAGRPVITDHVDGLPEIFGNAARSYMQAGELPGLVEQIRGLDCRESSRLVRAEHSYQHRAEEILRVLGIKKR